MQHFALRVDPSAPSFVRANLVTIDGVVWCSHESELDAASPRAGIEVEVLRRA